jgi:predicted transcriptional regulator
MHPVCEISSKYVLPVFRSKVVNILINERGLTQIEVAKLLSISQATVSLYVGQKRGFSQKFRSFFDLDVIDHYAHSYAEEITNNPSVESMEYFCALCKELRRKGLLCEIHRNVSGVSSNCKICVT